MKRVTALVAERLIVPTIGIALLATAPLGAPAARAGLTAACGAGALAGCLLFGALARKLPAAPLVSRPVLRTLALAFPPLAASAVGEEALWRYLAFGATRLLVGAAGAFAAATAAFAVAHAHAGPRAVCVHAATGATFGLVYLVTGRIVAAVCTHLVYNLLVVAARAAWLDAAARAAAA